jgi:hypothetical protein
MIKKGPNSKRGTWAHNRIALHMTFNKFPKFSIFVMNIFERFASGDLTLVSEIVNNHDEINDSNTTLKTGKNHATGERVMLVKTVSKEVLKTDDAAAKKNLKYVTSLKSHIEKLKIKELKLTENLEFIKETLSEHVDMALQLYNEKESLEEKIDRMSEETRKAAEEARKAAEEAAEEARKAAEEAKARHDEAMKKADERHAYIVRQNNNLLEHVELVEGHAENIEEQLGEVSGHLEQAVYDRAPSSNIPNNLREVVVIFKLDNCISYEKDYVVCKGQLRYIERSLTLRIRALEKARRIYYRRRRQRWRASYIPVLTELARFGVSNGSTPNAKQLWRRVLLEHGRHFTYNGRSTVCFSLEEWTEDQLTDAIETMEFDRLIVDNPITIEDVEDVEFD